MVNWIMFVSDALSIFTITLCVILKVPQILRLIQSGRAAGLSVSGLLLELSSYTVTMMYNYTNGHSFLTYLEYPIILIQEYILIGFVMHYKKYKPMQCVSILSVFVLITIAFALSVLPKSILTLLLPSTTPLSAVSKIMQLYEILVKKNANSVSVQTWFLSFFTNATRIFTVYVDSADFYLLLNFSVSSFLSGAVMASAIYYQRLEQTKLQ